MQVSHRIIHRCQMEIKGMEQNKKLWKDEPRANSPAQAIDAKRRAPAMSLISLIIIRKENHNQND